MSHENELAALKNQVDQVQCALREAERVIEQVQQRIETLEAERREHRRAVLETLPEGPAELTAEELDQLRNNGATWEVIEQDLQTILGG